MTKTFWTTKKEPKTFWVTDNRFKLIVILLMIIFFTLMALFYLKADEVTKDPCSICAERMGEKVICRIGDANFIQRIYYPNQSILNKENGGL